MTKYVSAGDAALQLDRSYSGICWLIRKGYLKAENVAPHLKKPIYVISQEVLDEFVRENPGRMKAHV